MAMTCICRWPPPADERQPGPNRQRSEAALVDLGRRGQGRYRTEGDHAEEGPHVEGLRGRRRRRRFGDDGAEVARGVRQRPAPPRRSRPVAAGWARRRAGWHGRRGKAEKWDELLPKAIADGPQKYKGQLHRRAVNVHRVNWLWANPEVFKKAGAKLPTTWDEFFVAAEALKKAGVIPVARQPELADFTTFESAALGVGGADFYQKALVKLDAGSLKGPTMHQGARNLQEGEGLHRQERAGPRLEPRHRDGHQGEAGMQLMGDWAKGEVPRRRQRCRARTSPAARRRARPRAYTYNVDSFALFQLKDPGQPEGAAGLAAAIMSHRLPGGVQPQTRLHSRAPGHEAGQVRRLRQDLQQSRLRRQLQNRLAGALRSRTAWPSAPSAEGAMKDAGLAVLERRQDDRRRCRKKHGRRREDQETCSSSEPHLLPPLSPQQGGPFPLFRLTP